MATVYLYKFNNYYNRQLKRFDTLSEYGDYNFVESDTYFNFNPNDGVDTYQILGRSGNAYFGDCDYFIFCDNNNLITSRWFIIEQTRVLKGQYRLTLHRDLIADNYKAVLNSDAFIEKATITDDNQLIFNKENVELNQIKVSETPLKDSSGCAWIVGYLARNYEPTGAVSITADTIADYTFTNITDWAYFMYRNTTVYSNITNQTISATIAYQSNSYAYSYTITYGICGYHWQITSFASQNPNISMSVIQNAWEQNTNVLTLNRLMDEAITNRNVYLDGTDGRPAYSGLNRYINTVLKDEVANIYYKVNRINSSTNINVEYLSNDLRNEILRISNAADPTANLRLVNNMKVSVLYSIEFQLNIIAGTEYTVNIPASQNRLSLKDAPYDMFCIPYSNNLTITNSLSTPVWTSPINISESVSMVIAQGIAQNIGAQNIYDIQLLPYCPMSGFIINDNNIDINTSTDSSGNTVRYTLVKNYNDANVGILLWATASSGSIDISYNVNINNKKLENQTDMFRLVSPNYNGTYEFNAARNNGIYTFNVDYTYKPYQPYIHVNPVFSGLYGSDFNDSRGLICGGDFSIAYLSDAWANYQVSNKNYANIFDREIQNMDVNRKYERISQVANAVSGTATGAGIGSSIGIGGAIMGGIASLGGGVADIAISEKLYNETLDYKNDMFGMQLDNIKALPYSLAKSTAFTSNNKIFPIVEKFTCTDVEKTAFAKKIAWNGMTLGIIDKLINYVGNTWNYGDIIDRGYVKLKLIRLEDVADDYHYAEALSKELDKGVYIK